jgi:hypothetical protein
MDFETIKSWLAQWSEKQAKTCRLKGIAGVILGPIALAVASVLVYAIALASTHDRSYNSGNSTAAFWITIAVLPLMFIGNRLVPRRDLMDERMSEGPEDSFVGRYVARRVALLYFFMWILFTGPRLFDWAFRSFREVKSWKEMDTHSCAAVLWLLLTRQRKVPYEDIRQQLDWLDLDTTAEQLKLIPGILFLQTPPPGLSLTQEFRDEVRKDLLGASAATAGAI